MVVRGHDDDAVCIVFRAVGERDTQCNVGKASGCKVGQVFKVAFRQLLDVYRHGGFRRNDQVGFLAGDGVGVHGKGCLDLLR